MGYAIKSVRGMLIIVCFWFVCLFVKLFSILSLSLLFISQWQMLLSQLRSAHLSVIFHSSPFDMQTIEQAQNIGLCCAKIEMAAYQ